MSTVSALLEVGAEVMKTLGALAPEERRRLVVKLANLDEPTPENVRAVIRSLKDAPPPKRKRER